MKPYTPCQKGAARRNPTSEDPIRDIIKQLIGQFVSAAHHTVALHVKVAHLSLLKVLRAVRKESLHTPSIAAGR
jgi:hypothetical protein